ncbi:MAG: hypothetical protein ACWGQW_21905, partial [bacterium]
TLERKHLERLLKMIIPIWVFVWLRQYRFDEVIFLYERALATFHGQEESRTALAAYGRLHICLAHMIAMHRGANREARQLANEGLKITETVGDKLGQALGQYLLPYVSRYDVSLLSDALPMLEDSAQTFLELDRLSLAGRSMWTKALVLHHQGAKPEDCRSALHESLPMFQKTGDHWMNSAATRELAITWFQQGDYPKAMMYLQEGLSITQQYGYPPLAFSEIADLNVVIGDFEQARSGYQRMKEFVEDIVNLHKAAQCLIDLSIVATLEGRFEEAEELLVECRQLYPILSRGTAYEDGRGRLAHRRGEYSEALHRFDGILRSETNRLWITHAQLMQGMALTRLGRLAHGKRSILLGLKKAHASGWRYRFPRAIFGLAEIARLSGQKQDAVKLAALIHTHDVTPFEVKTYATDLLKALESELSPDEYETAHAQGKALDLDVFVQQLLDDNAAA